ncbi:MAG: hypothetical protein CMJ72_14570 [Planctomycetaceae bacterium]|nr:hypothetical protein [Planctomycetaceae bacterium]
MARFLIRVVVGGIVVDGSRSKGCNDDQPTPLAQECKPIDSHWLFVAGVQILPEKGPHIIFSTTKPIE